jgi:CRISPR system Cascade subunit CasC
MTEPRFLQIHTLHSYTAALLNRDDSGLAKRLPYGGAIRTRISSQCLKRHWRTADRDPHSLHRIEGAELAFRSRELVTKKIIAPLKAKHPARIEVLDALEPEIQKAVYGDKADKGKQSRQTLLFGAPELAWLSDQVEKLTIDARDAASAKDAAAAWIKTFKENIKVMRDGAALPWGANSRLIWPDGHLRSARQRRRTGSCRSRLYRP